VTALLEDTVAELTKTYGTPAKTTYVTACRQLVDWRIGDTDVQFKAETDRLGLFGVSIAYRHLPTVQLVREADFTNKM
jgi:hypothetical protein